MISRRQAMTGGAVLCVASCARPDTAALVDDAAAAPLPVMDFAPPFSLQPLPPGFVHRRFWTRAPMTMALARRDGIDALRCETRASASMLVRQVDIAIERRPLLAWRWLVEVPIEAGADERTREGDDHPARFFLGFRTGAGERRAMEIVWGNRVLARGDWKYLGTFPHYVANGGMANVGRWHDEQVDLRALVAQAWPQDTPVSISEIGVFCDSDETRSRSVAWFAAVRLLRG
ncbi:MAG: DUF3047 domain-containing protein [Alphaproteobacteria bacterium]|nr:DUF3047 domain-containing protein [Alphaproteobacteria bacterium]